LWEGQTALLHRDDDHIPSRDARSCGAARDGPLRGVFVPRDSASRKQPSQLTAWFGLDSAALAGAGVKAGSSVTSYKCSARLASTRFTARAIDDRVGDAALILSLELIDRTKLDHKVIFAWSVREEAGLEGAKALAAALGPDVSRVYAIDTFVSSDSPLESSHFANAKLGEGVVSRALDNSSVTPPALMRSSSVVASADDIQNRWLEIPTRPGYGLEVDVAGGAVVVVVGATVVVVTHSSRVAAAVDRVTAIHGAATCAGIFDPGDYTDITNVDPEVFDRVLGVNLKGTFRVRRAVLPKL